MTAPLRTDSKPEATRAPCPTTTEILALWDAERSAGLPPHERIKALSRASENEMASR